VLINRAAPPPTSPFNTHCVAPVCPAPPRPLLSSRPWRVQLDISLAAYLCVPRHIIPGPGHIVIPASGCVIPFYLDISFRYLDMSFRHVDVSFHCIWIFPFDIWILCHSGIWMCHSILSGYFLPNVIPASECVIL
jgi:hypothetical protein